MRTYDEDMFDEAKKAFMKGDDKTAEPILQQMLLQNKKNPEVHQMLATIFYNQGKFSKAIQMFKRALEIDPTYTDASVGLSIILNDLGKYDEGKQVFLEAKQRLHKTKGQPDPWVDEKIASKHEELADLYSQYKRYAEALEQLFKAQKLSSRKPEISMRIAETHVQLGHIDRALKDLRQLIRDYPSMMTARLKLGLILYNSNNIADAVEQWETVLTRDPENPEALRYLRMAQVAGITTVSL